MIWTPSRQLLPPPRGNRRLRPPFARQYGMADGDISLDAAGNRILDDSGNAYLACCCTYTQFRKCSDGTYVDLWIAGTGLNLTVLKSGVKYYVNPDSNTSITPGTLIGTYTVTTGCFSCAACSTPTSVKNSYLLTFSGISSCGCLPSTTGSGGFVSFLGNLNGSYTVNIDYRCQGITTSPSPYWAGFNSTPCTAGTEVSSGTGIQVGLYLSGTTAIVEVVGTASYLFQGHTNTTANCSAAFTINNSQVFSDCSEAYQGYDGQVVVTPIP